MKKANKIKRNILIASVVIALIVFVISICMLDSESWIPTITCAISLIWLLIMGIANGLFG